MKPETRGKNNRTLVLHNRDAERLEKRLITAENIRYDTDIVNKTLNGDLLHMLPYIPDNFADLIIIDPPYNLTKDFNGMKFNSRTDEVYDEYLQSWFPAVCKKLKPHGSLYYAGTGKAHRPFKEPLKKS